MLVARIINRRFVGFSLAVVLIALLEGVVDGQDLSLDNLEQLGFQARRRGDYNEATQYFRLALERAETLKVSETVLVVSLGSLAEMLRNTRQFDEAGKLFDRAVAILRTSSAADKRFLPVILANQGRLYQQTGKYAASESILKQARDLTERHLGAQHWNMAQVHNSLGILYWSINKRKEAESSFKKAIAIEEKRTDPQDGALAPILGNLALFYQDEGRWIRAEPLLIRALRIAEAYLGPDHIQTGGILNKLGLSYHGQGKLKEAEAALRRALEIRRQPFGLEDGTVAITLFDLARVLSAQGNYDEAKLRYTETLQVLEKNLGRNAPALAMPLEEFARLLRKMKNNTEAFAMEARAKFIRAEMKYTVKVRKGSRE